MSPVPPDWPFAEASRFIDSRPHRWHVQQIGAGPDILLLHGAGGATHSWRALASHLSGHRLTMIDLPGHGFTRLRTSSRSGLDPMAEDIQTLIQTLNIAPTLLIGHSAGAAIALRLAQNTPTPVLSINGAFQMFDGFAAWLFPIMAKALSLNPLTPYLFTAGSTLTRTRRLIEGTGSRIDATSLAHYHHLISNRAHVSGALTMMANWSLDALLRDAPHITAPVLLLTGAQDQAVPPSVSADMSARLPNARHHRLPGYGHLLHEEAPAEVAGALRTFLKEEVA